MQLKTPILDKTCFKPVNNLQPVFNSFQTCFQTCFLPASNLLTTCFKLLEIIFKPVFNQFQTFQTCFKLLKTSFNPFNLFSTSLKMIFNQFSTSFKLFKPASNYLKLVLTLFNLFSTSFKLLKTCFKTCFQASTRRWTSWRRRSTPSRACTTTCTRRCTRSTRPAKTICSSTESGRTFCRKFLPNWNRKFMKFSGFSSRYSFNRNVLISISFKCLYCVCSQENFSIKKL